MEKHRKRDVQACLMLTLNVGMTHDLANLAELSKTYGMKVSEIANQVSRTCAGGTLSPEEANKIEQQFIKRIQTLNLLMHEVRKLTKKMEKV